MKKNRLKATVKRMTGIGQRILERRKALGLTQAELASKLGVAASACSQWEAEVMRPNGDNILALAKVLQVQPAWVTTGHSAHGVAELGEPNLDFTQVPVIDIMTLTPSFSVGKHSGDIRVLRSTTADVSPKAFSIQVEGDAMSNPLGAPSFPAGMFIIIDPTVEPQSGNFVVACLGGKGRGGLFKKYVVDGPHKFLQSLNPNFQMIELDKKATILGVAIRAEVDLV